MEYGYSAGRVRGGVVRGVADACCMDEARRDILKRHSSGDREIDPDTLVLEEIPGESEGTAEVLDNDLPPGRVFEMVDYAGL